MKQRLECTQCQLEMTRAMMAFHLRNDHKILKCFICSEPVLRFGISVSNIQGAFCSSPCREESVHRGLCSGCAKPHGRPPAPGTYCSDCRRRYAYLNREIRLTRAQERALSGPSFVPPPYQRTQDSKEAS